MPAIGASNFPVTQWTNLVQVCRSGDLRMREQALEILCRDYWHPLFSFARRNGFSQHDSEDLTQGFMSYVVERDLFSAADQEQGKLRTFLLVIFQRYIRDHRDRARAAKRGGEHEIVSLEPDVVDAHRDRHAAGPGDLSEDPAVWFNRIWARSLIDAAVKALKAEETAAGREAHFAALSPFLNPESVSSASYSGAALHLDTNEEAVRKAVSRLRRRFRDSLRSQIAATLSHPTEAEIDEELAALRSALQG